MCLHRVTYIFVLDFCMYEKRKHVIRQLMLNKWKSVSFAFSLMAVTGRPSTRLKVNHVRNVTFLSWFTEAHSFVDFPKPIVFSSDHEAALVNLTIQR